MWRAHVARVAAAVQRLDPPAALIPVVKGNGYGFGRLQLTEMACEFASTVAVGTVLELDVLELPALRAAAVDVVVLTPTLQRPDAALDSGRLESSIVFTVGAAEHIAALSPGDRCVVKLASPMQRYGRAADLVTLAREHGLRIEGVAVHPPLAGSDVDHAEAVRAAIVDVPPELTVYVSHLTPDAVATLPRSHRYGVRIGTALWHGAREALHLEAQVLDVRPAVRGAAAGYRQVEIPTDGHLVMVGAGSAQGVTPLSDGRSPFHFRQRRVALLEAPHMHTTMLFVPATDPVPDIGEYVDLQRPLTMTHVDTFRWI